MGSFAGFSTGSGEGTGAGVLIGSSAGSTTMAGFSLPVFIAPPELGSSQRVSCALSASGALGQFCTF
jgi:hypothetical protein